MKCTALPFTCTERSTHPDFKRTCTSFSHTQAKNVHGCYEIIHPDALTPAKGANLFHIPTGEDAKALTYRARQVHLGYVEVRRQENDQARLSSSAEAVSVCIWPQPPLRSLRSLKEDIAVDPKQEVRSFTDLTRICGLQLAHNDDMSTIV